MHLIMIETEPMIFCDECAKSFIEFAKLDPSEYRDVTEIIPPEQRCDICKRLDGRTIDLMVERRLIDIKRQL